MNAEVNVGVERRFQPVSPVRSVQSRRVMRIKYHRVDENDTSYGGGSRNGWHIDPRLRSFFFFFDRVCRRGEEEEEEEGVADPLVGGGRVVFIFRRRYISTRISRSVLHISG